MNRKLLFSIASIAAALGLVAGVGTTALLMDVDDNPGNELQAGSLMLSGSTSFANGAASCAPVDLAQDDWTATFKVPAFGDLAPGAAVRTTAVCISNDGSIDGTVDLVATSIVDHENGCVDPEGEAGDLSCAASQGELSENLSVGISVYDPAAGACPSPPAPSQTVTIAQLQAGVDLASLAAASKKCVGFAVTWPTSASDNLANGDSTTFDLVWTLTQAP